MNSLRYLASSLSYRSTPPPPPPPPSASEKNKLSKSGERIADAADDEKAVARARRPTKKNDERRKSRRVNETEVAASKPVLQVSLIWRILGLFLPFLMRESREAPHKFRDREKKHRQTSSTALPTIPRMLIAAKRKTLVLDLDETLIHSMTRGNSSLGPSQMVEVHLQSTQVSSFYYVAKRPHCNDFLQAVLQWYDVAIFTASVKEYADPIIDLLERDLGLHQAFKRRFYRSDCIPDSSGSGGYIKDLSVLGEDLARVMLVDNSAISYIYQQANGIPVEGWISDPSDRALLHLLPLLFALRHTIDVRSVLCLQNSGALIST